MHGCNFESDRRRKVGSGSLSAKERYVRIGGRTESNRKQAGGEVVHRLWPGLDVEASAPAAEQLRETYTGRSDLHKSRFLVSVVEQLGNTGKRKASVWF
jgi:hypothetical protein